VQEFLNLNKPLGITSHDCVRQVRRLLKIKRVGHAGTLDPLAAGVLPIALGPATRLLQFLRQDKAYRATIRLGIATTTDDLEGELIAASPVPQLSLESVEVALHHFQGQIQQVPPCYSAIHVQGKRLYELARSGNTPEVKARPVEIFELKVLAWRSGDFPELDLAIACGPGTYIRAIARDLGAALETGGTLAALTRTESSGFSFAESLTLAELESQIQNQTFCPIPAAVALNHLPEIILSPEIAQRWCWGQRISLNLDTPLTTNTSVSKALEAKQPKTLRVHHETGRFLGIAQQVNSETGSLLIPQVVVGSVG
jgi:tRNA pseudouridine55 synthase